MEEKQLVLCHRSLFDNPIDARTHVHHVEREDQQLGQPKDNDRYLKQWLHFFEDFHKLERSDNPQQFEEA